LYLVKLINLLK